MMAMSADIGNIFVAFDIFRRLDCTCLGCDSTRLGLDRDSRHESGEECLASIYSRWVFGIALGPCNLPICPYAGVAFSESLQEFCCNGIFRLLWPMADRPLFS